MKEKKPAPKSKKKAAKKRTRKAKPEAAQRPYQAPHTAAELGIVCAECGKPAEWFDYKRARDDHLKGFICSEERRSPQAEKLLVTSGQGSMGSREAVTSGLTVSG